MCGIVGYIGKENAMNYLCQNLKKLEYRGYDSAGIAVLENDKINVVKSVGNISKLENALPKRSENFCGIAHTRWATHGKATINNAHPHLSQNGQWAVVHNGIIENFAEIKEKLQNEGVKFSSETDTEVVAALLEQNSNLPNKQNLIKSISELNGSYALVCLNKNENNTLFLAKNKSPLYLAKCKNEILVGSDPICFIGKSEDYYCFNDGDFAIATDNNISFFDATGKDIAKEKIKLEIDQVNISKNEYDHYMIKEIYETKNALHNIARIYKNPFTFAKFTKEFASSINKIKVIGCGTAYNSGLIGAKYLERHLKVEATTHIASEFRYSNPIIDKKTLCVFVSQSGETADTLACLELAKSKHAQCVVITNVAYSTMAKLGDIVLPVCAGPEIAVASTKAYTCQLAVFYLLANHFEGKNCTPEIEKLAKSIDFDENDELLKKIAKDFKNEEKIFYLGRDLDYDTSQEGSLKIKEITYINVNAYALGELKHGLLALIDNKTPCVVFATNQNLLDKSLNGIHEVMARGGRIFLVTNLEITDQELLDKITLIKIKDFEPELMPILSILPAQILSYYTSIYRGINPDQPKNLAKSVTVE